MAEQAFGEKLGVSVGTALALEPILFDGNKDKIKNIWINLRTLSRNFIDSWDDYTSLDKVALGEMFWLEVIKLDGILRVNDIKVSFYVTQGSEKLQQLCKLAAVRLPKTEKQKGEYYIQENLLSYGSNNAFMEKVLKFNFRLMGAQGKDVYLITHNPFDLLSDYEFGNLYLLESYTGKVKTRVDWSTKLLNKEMPFNILTLQVFGDKSQFYSNKSLYKKEMIRLLKENKWNKLTHISKIKRDLRSSDIHELLDMANIPIT